MTEKESEFSVGYRKPPRDKQFKPGQSGNPSGRPKKKASTFAETFAMELNSQITVNEGGKQRKITKLQAIAKQQTIKAVNGDPKATALVMRAVEPREVDQPDNLSPVLHAMRALHARHEITQQNHTPATAVSLRSDNVADNGWRVDNDPA